MCTGGNNTEEDPLITEVIEKLKKHIYAQMGIPGDLIDDSNTATEMAQKYFKSPYTRPERGSMINVYRNDTKKELYTTPWRKFGNVHNV